MVDSLAKDVEKEKMKVCIFSMHLIQFLFLSKNFYSNSVNLWFYWVGG